MQSEPFSVTEKPSYAVVSLGRPATGNRLRAEEIQRLGMTIRQLAQSSNNKLVVVKAKGEAFCLGRQADGGKGPPKSALEIREEVAQPILDLYGDIRAAPVPVVAVVQGEAHGFGCALVAQCDLAIAADTAVFSFPEMDRNLPPTLAMSAALDNVPRKQLLHLVYTRRTIEAREALKFGLVSEVVSPAHLDDAVDTAVSDLASRNRQALCAVKEFMALGPYVDPTTSSRLAANILSVSFSP